jgi:hypothetical protein
MSLIIGFLGFWYDFIVGDAWEIALGVIIVLTLGAAVLRTNSVDQEIVPLLVAAGIWVIVAGSILVEARRRIHALTRPPR